MQPIDPDKLQMMVEAAALTQEQIDEFKAVSELLIRVGRVQRMDETQMLAAVDRLGYEVAKLSVATYYTMPNMSNEEVTNHPAVKPDVDKMDDIMLNIAFGSGMHKALIDVLLAERCDYHTDQFVKKLTFLRK